MRLTRRFWHRKLGGPIVDGIDRAMDSDGIVDGGPSTAVTEWLHSAEHHNRGDASIERIQSGRTAVASKTGVIELRLSMWQSDD